MASGNNYRQASNENDISLRRRLTREESESDGSGSSDEDLDKMNVRINPALDFFNMTMYMFSVMLSYMIQVVTFPQQDEDRLDDIHTHGDDEEDSLLNQSATQPEILVETAAASSLECGGTSQNVPTTSNIIEKNSNHEKTHKVSVDSGKMEGSKKVYSNPLVTNNPVQPNERNSTLFPIHDKVYDLDRPPDDELSRISMVENDNGQVIEEQHQPVEGNVKENSSTSKAFMTSASNICVKTKDFSTRKDYRRKRHNRQKTTAASTARDEETSVGRDYVKLSIEKSKSKDSRRAPMQSVSKDGHGNPGNHIGKNPLSSTESTEMIRLVETEGSEMPRTNTGTDHGSTSTTQILEARASVTPSDVSDTQDNIESSIIDPAQEQGVGNSVVDKEFNTSTLWETQHTSKHVPPKHPENSELDGELIKTQLVLLESDNNDYLETSSNDENLACANEASNKPQPEDEEIAHVSAVAQPPDQSAHTTLDNELATKPATFAQTEKQGIYTGTTAADTNSGSTTTSDNHHVVNQGFQANEEKAVVRKKLRNNQEIPLHGDKEETSDATSELLYKTNSKVLQCTHTDKVHNEESFASAPTVGMFEDNPSKHQNTTLSTNFDSMQGQGTRTENLSLNVNADSIFTSETEYLEKKVPGDIVTISKNYKMIIKEGLYFQENSTVRCDGDTSRAQATQTEEQHSNIRNQQVSEVSLNTTNNQRQMLITESNDQPEGAIKVEKMINKRANEEKAKTRGPDDLDYKE